MEASNWMSVGLAVLVSVAATGCAIETASGDEASVPEETIAVASSPLSGVHQVCRYATIRRSPGGQVFDFLSAGENFDIARHCGTHSDGSYCAWYFGHAYGHVHEDGWIEENAFNGC